MEIDPTDMTHHVHQHQPINNLLDDTLTQNPWMEIDNTNQPQVQHSDNVAHIQPNFQPCLTFIDTPETSLINVISPSLSNNVSTNIIESENNLSPKLQTVDDSIHSPPNRTPRNVQTYDARVPVSDIPGSLPSEKLNLLQGWFRGIDALQRIYVDEIFKTDYFILQFNSIHTMRKLIRDFNNDSETGATMTPIVYIRPKVTSKHASPHRNHRQTFKVIDLDGTIEQTELAKKAILALTHQDIIQFLHEQPSPNVRCTVWLKSAILNF